jgi:hypothetical protein
MATINTWLNRGVNMNYNRIFSLMLFSIVALAGVTMVSATSNFLVSFNEHYNTTDTRLGSCVVCHGSNAGYLNPYGAAYRNSNDDLASIETQDSDGDGFSNVEEINNLTFPGNPEDYPGNTSAIPPGTTGTVAGSVSNATGEVNNTTEKISNATEKANNTTERISNATNKSDGQQSPGFEAIFAVVGLLAVMYVKRGYIRK